MNTDVGVVKKYFTDRGYGFVTHTFLSGRQKEVFFHIKSVREVLPELAELLDKSALPQTIHFWYETELTNKGEHVRAVVRPETIKNKTADSFQDFVRKVERMWLNIDVQIPVVLYDATVDLIGIDKASELRRKREAVEEERRNVHERERNEREAAKKIEEEKRQRLIDEQNSRQKAQGEIEDREFEQLVSEMSKFKFTKSAQVSDYIVKNRLGHKYKNISGILQMELDGNTWDFEGGFPPKIYAKLCQRLGLGNQETRARPGKFESFKELAEKRR